MRAVLFPGQGIQRKGMGRELIGRYPDLIASADSILGYSLEELCLEDPRNELSRTAFTQPAIFVVSMLSYYDRRRRGLGEADFLAGHSVGEIGALAAAGAFDFETGLTLVQHRAALMGRADGGGLVAIVGSTYEEVASLLTTAGLEDLSIANRNTPTQTVVGGSAGHLETLLRLCGEQGRKAVRLQVSGAFHTAAMQEAADRFRGFLAGIRIRPPSTPVALNVTGQLYAGEDLHDLLATQIASPVLWSQCIEALAAAGADEFEELPSPGVLTRMVVEIRNGSSRRRPGGSAITPGAPTFDAVFGGRPLVGGGLGHGISGVELVRALATAGAFGFLDTEVPHLSAVESGLRSLASDPAVGRRYGACLSPSPLDPGREDALADLFIRSKVPAIEIRGADRPTEAARRYRGFSDGRVLARVCCRDDAVRFLEPEPIDGKPFAAALCVDMGVWRASAGGTSDLLRELLEARAEDRRNDRSTGAVLIGVLGACGNREGVEKAFSMGCDFIHFGSTMIFAEEARLPAGTRSTIRGSAEGSVQTLPDWWLPELASTSMFWLANDATAREIRSLQDLYLRRSADPAAIREAISRLGAEPRTGERMIHGARAALREAAAIAFGGRTVPCDPAFPQFREWSGLRGSNRSLGASEIADLLLPGMPGGEIQAAKGDRAWN
jgi:trans-AT polyketide synthase/acyltransferase/oxidoreductase domain-containing protein